MPKEQNKSSRGYKDKIKQEIEKAAMKVLTNHELESFTMDIFAQTDVFGKGTVYSPLG